MQARIAVLVSGGGTNLGALIKAQEEGTLVSGKIELVISNKADAYALKRAELAGIKTATVLRKECISADEFEDKISDLLEDHSIDLIVLAGFMAILSERFVKKYPERIINVHPSLIPSFCGKGFYGIHVHEAALSYGVKVSGATVHFVNEIPDGGRIILQKAVKVYGSDTPEKLQKRIMRQAEWKILPEATELVSKEIINSK